MDDVRAVMDAVGCHRAAFLGVSEGGPMSAALFAATYPDRTSALVLYGTYAYRAWSPDNPTGRTEKELEAIIAGIEKGWGEVSRPHDIWAPTTTVDEAFLQWRARWMRVAASPGAAVALSAVRVPSLVVHRTGDRVSPIDQGRYVAEHIPGARFVELSGDHSPWVGDTSAIVDAVEEFLTGTRHAAVVDRVLATVLFADIVGSTERAAALGDRRWRDLLSAYYGLVRRELARFRGREVDTAGDGFFASFDGPARAVRCAQAIAAAAGSLGVQVRAGLHTGECEIVGEKIAGIAVHIGAHIAGLASAGEVLASNTVKDLVTGSGLSFEDRGQHALKGVPGEWRLYASSDVS